MENSATTFNGYNNIGKVIEVENSETTLTNLMGRADNAIEKILETIISKHGEYEKQLVVLNGEAKWEFKVQSKGTWKDNMERTKGKYGKSKVANTITVKRWIIIAKNELQMWKKIVKVWESGR